MTTETWEGTRVTAEVDLTVRIRRVMRRTGGDSKERTRGRRRRDQKRLGG